MTAPEACDGCLRRTWLLARLAPHVERTRHERRPLRHILALSDAALLDACAGAARQQLAAEYERFVARDLRAAADHSALQALCRHAAGYPRRLLELTDAPAVVFVAGDAARLARLVGEEGGAAARVVAVVGMRKASADGLEVARGLGRGLAAAGVTVVSGMALGIDSAAHAGALAVEGPTVAVLAGGSDLPSPRRLASLYRALVEHGCVLSEMPPGFVPFKWCFPARNRIIAALAEMTIVVEAGDRSGALITAEVAADLGRDVAAVPGLVTMAHARGTNALLRDGATLVRDAGDALDGVLGVDVRILADPSCGLPRDLRSVLERVATGDDTVAALARTPGQAGAVLAALGELELRGRLRRTAGGRYVVVAR